MILAESLKSALQGVFLSKVAGLPVATWLKNELLNRYFSIILSTFWEHLL